MVKGRGRRRSMVSDDEDDLVDLDDISSDGIYKAVFIPNSATEASEKIPLMEGEGKSLKVLGFNEIERLTFVQSLMRFGTNEYDWMESMTDLKHKTRDEIGNYEVLFFSHLTEDSTDSPTFSDGVPKEGLMVQELLTRIVTLHLFKKKVKSLSDGATLFTEDIISQYPELRGGKFWKEHHDGLLLRAVLKHGYGKWKAIVDDKDSEISEVISQELTLPDINGPKRSQRLRDQLLRELPIRQVEFIKKRITLLEKGLLAEPQEMDDDEEMYTVVDDEPVYLTPDLNLDLEASSSDQTNNQFSLFGLIPESQVQPLASDYNVVNARELDSSGRPAKLPVVRKPFQLQNIFPED